MGHDRTEWTSFGKTGNVTAQVLHWVHAAGTVRSQVKLRQQFLRIVLALLAWGGTWGGVVGRPCGGLPSCWHALSAGSRSLHTQIRACCKPSNEMQTQEEGAECSPEPAALFSPLAGCQGPGMPSNKCGQRDSGSVLHWVPLRLAP